MADIKDIAIIFNPNSTGDAPGNARELKKQLKVALPDVEVTLLPTKYAGHAEKLAYDYAKKQVAPLIISASGDGGYNEVINGALRSGAEGAKPICAVLPSGNANDHARTVQEKPLLDLILAGKVSKLDILKVTMRHATEPLQERYAHSYVGIGLTPRFGLELNKNKLNTIEEARIIFKTFWRLRPVRIRYGRRTINVDSLICSLIPEMAKIITLAHSAKPQDGLFEVTLTKHRHKLILLSHLIRGAVLHLGKARHLTDISFTLLQPSPIQYDGEIKQLPKNTEVTITIHRGLLRTIARA
jgi:diacylglycerol kinase (ATP)